MLATQGETLPSPCVAAAVPCKPCGAAACEAHRPHPRTPPRPRRVRYNKSLPTPAALGAWFERYGRHVRRLHLRHLDAGAWRAEVLRVYCSMRLLFGVPSWRD